MPTPISTTSTQLPTSENPESIAKSTASSRDAISSRTGWRILIPFVLLAVYALQGMWFIRTQSFTWDEPLHIMAGLDEWRAGRFKLIPDHPPLGHLVATRLAADSGAKINLIIEPGVLSVDSITPNPEWLARRTRPFNLALGILLGALLWYTARKLFSEGSANLALALYAFSPAPIAHFSLVTTDGVTALTLFATAIQLVRWLRNPRWLQTLLLGAAAGLLLLSKMHAFVFVLMLLGFVLLPSLKDWRPSRNWRWQPAGTVLAVALMVLWSGYFFHVTHFTTQQGTLFNSFPPDVKPAPINISMEHNVSLWVPAGEYFYGFLQTVLRSEHGHAKYAFGKISGGIAPLMLPLTMLLKWPSIVLLLLVFAIFLFTTRKLGLPDQWPVLVAFPAVILLLGMVSKIALGDRHLLPAYPFALLFASAIWEFAAGRGSKQSHSDSQRRPILIAVIFIAVFANAIDVARYAPDYLSYFNPLVNQRQSYRLLADSNLDWGQGLLALKDYQAKHPTEEIHLAYFGLTDPSVYGIKAIPLEPNEFHSGTIVISATSLAGYNAGGPDGYRWVTQYPLKTMLNHSMFVYEVPPLPVH